MDVNTCNNQCLKLHVIIKPIKKFNYFKCKVNFIIELCYSIKSFTLNFLINGMS
jgi:hypothetical protein